IRHQIVAEIVALIDGGPERVCAGLPGQSGGIPKAGRKDAEAGSIRIVFADRGAAHVLTFVVIRSGTNGDIHLFPVPAERDITSEVVTASRHIHQRFSFSFKASVTGFVWIANDAVRVAD